MRIVVVSAHFPPNFVSGGTLQPQRIARGLRDRGHDVSVYAGWLGGARAPLETWDDVDETGLSVRWIVTTPWTGWNDDNNWDNPEVADDFKSYIAAKRPDVVHLHSLQSLGAGLIREAAGTGARVVVTMHDFWWVCARQFLVDRDLRPCCLVVDAGVCECEAGRAWLDQRASHLREMLADVDLVLAPSASAARVLEANGVDPERLAVDENGLPSSPTLRAVPAEGATEQAPDLLRLLYVGGSDELKGVRHLFASVRLLGNRPGWRLVAHGAARYLRESGVALDGLPVEVAPAFDPSVADKVYADADVLIVPSVMRESFSLVTREALRRGVPVVCTDTLGPEEVVEHERNGLIVPAGDVGALSAAIARLLDEPGLVNRLRAGCSAGVQRTIDHQVEGLGAIFKQLVDDPVRQRRKRAEGPGAVRKVLFMCGIEGAPLRYRARLPAEAIGLLGVASDTVHYRDRALEALAFTADIVVVYRVPATIQILELLGRLRDKGTPLLFDVDDLIFDPDLAPEIPALKILPGPEAELWLEGVRRYRTTLEACDAFVGSTAALCRHAHEVTGLPASRFDNGVGLLLARCSDLALRRARRPGRLRVGYLSGTDTHGRDWLALEPSVLDVLEARPDVELWLVGHAQPSADAVELLGPRLVRRPPVPWFELPGVLRDLDVNLAPLEPGSRFNEAKSSIKWLEAALTETPTLASSSEPFRETIRQAETGFVASDAGEWADYLDRLVGDDELRRRLGRSARRRALLEFSPHLQGRRYLAILERAGLHDGAGGMSGTRRATTWAPVALDEPPNGFVLEPYRIPSGFSPDSRNTRRVLAGMLNRKAAGAWRRLNRVMPRPAGARR